MDILERYLYAIERKLPKNSRDEVTKELRSLLMDNAENQYGEDPSEDDYKNVIKAFGSPTKIAMEYGSSNALIRPEYTPIFMQISKIIALALLVAFVIVGIINILNSDSKLALIGLELLKVITNTLQATISAIGILSVVFILISQFAEPEELNIGEDWSINDLPELPKSNEKVSISQNIAEIVFTMLAIIFFNAFSGLIQLFFDNMEALNIWHHHIIFDHFMGYIHILSILWAIEIVISILTLIIRKITRPIRSLKLLTLVASFAIAWIMFNDTSLYTGTMDLFGFRFILLIGLIFTPFDMISHIVKLIFPPKDTLKVQ